MTVTENRTRPSTIAPVVLVIVLGAAALARPGDEAGALQLANPDRSRVSELRAALNALPERPAVLVGLDADLGTYPEIRAAVRAAFDDLLARDARLAFVSFTPEGRAVASAELDRLGRAGVDDDDLLDLGFVAGAEAGMVRAVTSVLPADAEGSLADLIREADGGMAAFDLALVVGGGELGPRTWVEQVGPRLPSLPIAAIAPTFAQPELAPYLRTGQLVALLATLRDGAAYAASVHPTASAETDRVPSALAMLFGMVVALGVLGRSLASGVWGAPGAPGKRGLAYAGPPRPGASAPHADTSGEGPAAAQEPGADDDPEPAAGSGADGDQR
jgi:hypothetical protein